MTNKEEDTTKDVHIFLEDGNPGVECIRAKPRGKQKSSIPPVSCSSLGQHHDTARFRRLLCPDPSCEKCNKVTAEVDRLLFPEALEDTTPLASKIPVTKSSYSLSPAFSGVPPKDPTPTPLLEPFPVPPQIFSPNPMTSLADFVSPSSLSQNQQPHPFPTVESKFLVSHSPPLPLSFTPLPSHDIPRANPTLQQESSLSLNSVFSSDPSITQEIKALPGSSQKTNPSDSFACQHVPPMLSISPPPDCLSTATQLKSIFTSLKLLVPEDSSPDALSTLVLTVKDTDYSNLSTSEISCRQAYAKNLFLPTLSHPDFQQEHFSLHQPETCLWEDSVSNYTEASSHSFFGLNIQALLERQVKKRKAFQILEKNKKEEGPFSKQIWSEYQETSSENSLQPLDVQDTTVSQTDWDIKDKPEQLFYVKSLGKNLQQKYSQLFWGLPSLHSESLVAILVSRSSSLLGTHFFLFNGICNASTVKMQHQQSPSFPYFHVFPLLNVDAQHLPQIKPQSQSFTQVQPQPYFQFQHPILPSSSPSKFRDCEASYRSLNESYSDILNKNQHLEWHVLQKQQESLQGLFPILQKSQDATSSQAPNLPLVSQSPPTYVPHSIPSGHFQSTSESQEKLKLYVPSRLIPLRCPHAYRNLESLEKMVPQCKLTETSQQKGRHAHLQLSELQGQSSKSPGKSALSLPQRFCEGIPLKLQLRKDVKRNLGYILEKSPEDSPKECYLLKRRMIASKTKCNCVCHSTSRLGNELLHVPGKDIHQNHMKILRLHLSRKSWQIAVDRVPIGVCCSWLAGDNTLPPSGSSQTNIEKRNSKNTMIGRVYCQITTLELSFLDPNTRQVLEAHIIRFRMSQMWGLPLKVVKSIKSYTSRKAKTWLHPQFDFSSLGTHISGVICKAEISKSLERNCKIFQGNKLRTTNSVSLLDCPLPVSSHVSSEGQGFLKASHSDMEHELAENIQAVARGRHTFNSLTHSTIHNMSWSETVPGSGCSPEVPRKQAGAGHKPRHEHLLSSDRVELIQDKNTVKENSEHFPIFYKFRKLFKAQELCAVKSQSCDILMTQELGGSQMISVNTSKEEPLITECPPSELSDPKDFKLSNLKKQLLDELKFKLESKEQSQAQGCYGYRSLSADSLPSTSSLTQAQSVFSEDLGASQGLIVHLEDSGISKELRQEFWVSKNDPWKCQDNHFLPAAKKLRTLGSKARECGSEDSSVQTSTGRKKSHLVEDRGLEGTFQSLSQNEQFPSSSSFGEKIRQFFQWINSQRKIKELETPQQKAKFMSTFAQEYNQAESVAILSCELPETHELMTAVGKILEEKLACSHELEALRLSRQK
ncbi:spermatogenesis-associated protein 31D1-like [Saccopteryx leptura]|uniref:spermatogenesis-associated protein 31D1-like n=1 Tax=Saccopteryx leptura TaxID=249018 RepID=UPI00339C8764